tara:strand:- start:42138 stop:42335 length:198 start_codon:yes stop_codon:yes gene_type:complete
LSVTVTYPFVSLGFAIICLIFFEKDVFAGWESQFFFQNAREKNVQGRVNYRAAISNAALFSAASF